MRNKWKSRKFWISVAAFLGSIGTSIAGYQIGSETIVTVGICCAIISQAIYCAVEAATDIGCYDDKEE